MAMLLLEGGRLVCPLTGKDDHVDIRVKDGFVVEIGSGLSLNDGVRIDCSGAVVAPGLVDLGAELGDPGMTWREDLSTGSEAGAAGGFTTIIASPATDPVMDAPSLVNDLMVRGCALGGARVLPAGALTVGLNGEQLAEIGLLAEAGCPAISDGGIVVGDSSVLRRALDYVRPFGIPLLLRPGEPVLHGNGVMHEGLVSIRVGLRGVPTASEEIGLTRIVSLVRHTGCPVHITHVTSADGLRLVVSAKNEGLPITVSCPARNLLLCDEAVEDTEYDTRVRLEPPLRAAGDRAALRSAVVAGDIDALISDHRPWSRVEKEVEFEWAQPGAIGLETALGAALEGLEGDVSSAIRALAVAPASVVGRRASVEVGGVADLVVFEPLGRQVVGQSRRSRGTNEPLEGWDLPGRIRATLVEGRVVYGPQLP